jgi:hypothetical protein
MKHPDAPIFRAYHKPSNIFITDGMITSDNKFLRIVAGSIPLPMSNVYIDLFTGHFAESGEPIYQNDIVEIATPNEFGSVLIDKGMVRYDVAGMCFTIISESMKGADRVPTQIVRVIGHSHD